MIYLRARYMQPRLGIFLARDPWSGDQLRPGSMNGWNYGDDNPVNRVDPSGLFSALTWARSAGFSADIPGVSQWLSNLDPHWGWAKMLLDADEGDFAYVWGRTPPWDISPYGRFYCENGKAHINIEPAEFREGNENRGDFVPLPGGYRGSTAGLDPSGLGWAWRDQVGATLLSSKTGVRTDYRDGGNSGNIIDLPDFVLYGGVDLPVEIPIPGVSGVTPALSAFIIDRYGNLYSSVGVGGGVIGGINFYGEGYMFKSFTQNISFATEEELKNALVWLSLSGGGGFGAKIDVSIGWGFTGIIYSGTYVGVGVGGSVNLGFQLLSQKDSRLSWNWMFQVLGPSLDSVWDDIVWDFANNPCGECTPP